MALKGVTVLEIAGLAPSPFCGVILADFGATVIRVDRAGAIPIAPDFQARGKKSMALDFKNPLARDCFLQALERADVVIEPFRPGVMEKLGLGPEIVCKRNPRIVYARLTGFGQDGGCSSMAGHDINYLSMAGTLSLIGRKDERPMFPVNMLADFAGGGMLCAMGVVMALFERERSGRGQVIDSAMMDGAAYLSSFVVNLQQRGAWHKRGTNMLDSGAPFYDVYRTQDGGYVGVGAIEPQFYAALLKGLGLPKEQAREQMDREAWPKHAQEFARIFASQPRAHWEKVFLNTDACVTPVLELDEVATHPAMATRKLLVPDRDGNLHVAPAPRLSRTPASPAPGGLPAIGCDTASTLLDLGVESSRVRELLASGGAVQADEGARL
mmetsp:Transcript_29673/g.68731  ORF Transcript_29673/g.68731 Transcript_29673/m.68731 type:complete len:383 (-) Transcript_29673:268-1416(-)